VSTVKLAQVAVVLRPDGRLELAAEIDGAELEQQPTSLDAATKAATNLVSAAVQAAALSIDGGQSDGFVVTVQQRRKRVNPVTDALRRLQ
jgi:hypothetical protein